MHPKKQIINSNSIEVFDVLDAFATMFSQFSLKEGGNSYSSFFKQDDCRKNKLEESIRT